MNYGKDHHRFKHGMRWSRPYRIWCGMKTRCLNPDSYCYGVFVCEKWKLFSGFWEDMKDSYFDGSTIDRKDNSKGYEPSNCRWATWTEQSRNRRNVRRYDFHGKSLTIPEIAKLVGRNPDTLWNRLIAKNIPFDLAIKKGFNLNNTSGFRGVYYRKDNKQWRTNIRVNGEMINLGTFKSKKEAIRARKSAEKKYHTF